MSDLVPEDIFDRLPERYRLRARQIKARIAEINPLLMPCEINAIRDAGARLHGQLRPQPDIDIGQYAAEFRQACSDLPEWAISEATNDYLAGRVENHTGQFMPTCAEFARHARSIVRPFAAERAGLRNEAERLFQRAEDDRRRELIAIERSDPSVRKRVAAMVRKATAGAAVISTDHRHAGTDDETQARLDAMKRQPAESKSKISQSRIAKGASR